LTHSVERWKASA